eukprot:417001_1
MSFGSNIGINSPNSMNKANVRVELSNNLIAENSKQSISSRLLCISKCGGYYKSHFVYKTFIASYMMTIVVILIHEAWNKEDGYPIGLNIYIGLMELETFILYLFGLYHINKEFLSELLKHLSFINECH